MLLAFVLVAAGGAFYQGRVILGQDGPLPQASDVVVPRGSTTKVASVLVARGVIPQPWQFQAAVWLTRNNGTLHAAEFAFPAHASLAQVLAILRTGRPVEHHLTIVEGTTSQQIKAVLDHADAMTGTAPTIPEGSVLPQTYAYEYGAERPRLVERATVAMQQALAAGWAGRAADLPLASPQAALILASIVERETAKPEERPHVAAVYLNRLRLGMRLQADPTVAYQASSGSGALDHPLTRAELDHDGPFNTYRVAGLPPTPICAPSLESVQAVLHPADSNDLYFVADGSGGHVFSRNFEAHDAAVARWRALTAPHQRTD